MLGTHCSNIMASYVTYNLHRKRFAASWRQLMVDATEVSTALGGHALCLLKIHLQQIVKDYSLDLSTPDRCSEAAQLHSIGYLVRQTSRPQTNSSLGGSFLRRTYLQDAYTQWSKASTILAKLIGVISTPRIHYLYELMCIWQRCALQALRSYLTRREMIARSLP